MPLLGSTTILEKRLGNNDYLAGSYSFADIAFYMAQLFGARMGAGMSDVTPNLQRWRHRLSARPAIRQVVGPMADFLVAEGRSLPEFMQAFASR